MEENLPPGFRFHPTDEELITCYLTRKVSDSSFTSKAIAVVDLNKSEPWDLPGKASMGEKEWYFFSLRDRKYPTGVRTNRATESGYWKTTGKDKEIIGGEVLVGMKKTLVFYRGRAPRGEKTNWVMHEYRLQKNNHHFRSSSKDEWVVCRVFQKSLVAKRAQQTSLSLSDSPCDTSSLMLNEFGDVELSHLNNNIANSSSGSLTNISGQTFNVNDDLISNNNVNTNMTMINWPATSQVPSLAWPSGFTNPNVSVNSLLLKALQLRSSHFAPYMPQGVSHIGNDISSNLTTSSELILECMPQHQQQEQPFNLDSIW